MSSMIYYNWNRVFRHTGGKPTAIVEVIDLITKSTIAASIYDIKIKKYNLCDFEGNATSFLVNPELLLFEQSGFKKADVAMYIALASHRPIAMYTAFRKTTLDVLHCPVPLETLNKIDKRLLFIDGDSIHFVFEESNRKI